MKYTGRFMAILFTCMISGYLLSVQYYFEGVIHPIHLIVLSVLLIPAWWGGKKYDQVKYLADKDALTDLPNRRYIHQIFPQLLAMVQRKEETMGLLLIDVDEFKMINDCYGHDCGDKVLRHISQILSGTVRKSDVVSRYGGDEFLILTPFTNHDGIQELMDRLQKKFTVNPIHESFTVSVSIGSGMFPSEGTTLDDLIAKADQDMYARKECKKIKK